MKKILYWIGYNVLQLSAYIQKKKLVHIGKDFFIFHDRVVELKGLYIVDVLKYNTTVQFITDRKFYINGKTVIDLEDGIDVIYHDVDLRKNNIGFIIDNKQYNNELELMDEGEVYAILYKILITRTKVKKGYIYKVFNIEGELLHTFPVYDGLLKIQQEGDFIKCILGKNTDKLIHIGGFKDLIQEYK